MESFHDACERFKDILRKCPDHGITIAQQVQYFYASLTPFYHSNVDSSSIIKNKSIEEAYDLFEVMSKQCAMWPDRHLQMGASEAYSLVLEKIYSLARKVKRAFYIYLYFPLRTHGTISSSC